ncbi:vomeronasal type-2 receptor 26-like [Protopterus annectens]|uniref:vomeronasal type-2 receptor 26-like n=1 Tax=Protopterus annectens TaxID=7888 RepID=UPI001CFA1CA6|nr:vomeronasal type-2 receptor 26-like [Protopterus annectens]
MTTGKNSVQGVFTYQVLTAILDEEVTTSYPRISTTTLFRIRAYRFVQVVIFAINEINHNKKLLPNITLGFSLYDGCFSEPRALDRTIHLLSGHQQAVPNYSCHSGSLIPGFIGDEPSQSAIPMARILGIYRYPQISFGAARAVLSDKIQFPSFLRTVAPDINQARGMANMMRYFGWNWVGFIGAGTDSNLESLMNLKGELLKTGTCTEFLEVLSIENIHSSVLRIADTIQKSTAKIILNYATVQYAIPVIEEAANQNVTGKVWITPTYWSISPDLSKKIKDALNGSVGFAIHRGLIPGFKEFLYNIQPSKFPDDPFVKRFWEEAFFCKWLDPESLQSSSAKERSDISPCTGQEKLETLDTTVFDVNNFRFTYGVYNAVYSLAYALYNLQKCIQREGPFNNGSCATLRNFQPWQVLHYMKSTRFVNNGGEEIFYDKYGDSPAIYDIQNWQVLPDGSGRYVKVGVYNTGAEPGQELAIKSSDILWSKDFAETPRSVCSESCTPGHRMVVQEGKPLCCFDCIPCPVGEVTNQSDARECLRCPEDHWHDTQHTQCRPKVVEFLSYNEPLGVSLAFFAVCFSVVSAFIMGLFAKNRETPIVKANNREVSYLLLVSLCLCFLSSLIFIGEPQKMSCLLRQTGFGIIFSICVSSILAKTIIVVIAFKATVPNSKLRKWVGMRTPVTIILFCSLIQVIICTVWIANTPSFPERNTNSEDGKIIHQCNEGSVTIFYCMLGYLGFLASVSFTVAFLARNLPDSFNEAKFITFSMLVFTSVWASFIPAYLSTTGKYMVAVEVFAILASSSGLLVCIFSPKCYIILIRSEKFTFEISHAAGLPVLSDKIQFPSFLRTMSSGYYQPFTIVQFIKHFGWTWVGIVYADNDFSVQGSQQLKAELNRIHVCLAFYEIIPVNPKRNRITLLVDTIVSSNAAVIMIYAYATEVALIMEEMRRRNVTGKVWLASSSWVTDSIFSKKELWSILNGVIGFIVPAGLIPGFKDFLYSIHPLKYPKDIYIKSFWGTVFHCLWIDNVTSRLPPTEGHSAEPQFCTGEENPQTLDESIYPVSNYRNTYCMFNAVYSFAQALNNLQSCMPGEGPFANRTCAERKTFKPWQLLHYIRKVHFRNKAGQAIYFDENGDVPASYEIINWQLRAGGESINNVKIGRYQQQQDGHQELILNETVIMWSGGYTQTPQSDCSNRCPPGYRKAPVQGMPVCCYDCVPCSEGEIANETDATNCMKCPDDSWSNEEKEICIPKQEEYLSFEDPMGAVLTTVSIVFAIIPAATLWIFIRHQDSPIVKANNRNLSYFLLVALILCFLCSLIFIGKPNNTSCLLRQSAFGIIFSVCISFILAKTIIVFIAFSVRRPGGFLQKWVGTKTPVFIGLCSTTLQIIICTLWLGLSSPFQEKNTKLYNDKIIIECNEGSVTMFYCMLLYLGLLASVCFVVAFLVRNLPDRYNEAKFITFSMLIFVSVWLTFVPAYLSTKGKYLVAVEIFAILSSGFGLLSCIFFPKCYIVVLRPELNIKESATQNSC